MNGRVLEYPLLLQDEQTVEMISGAEIVSVQVQGDSIQMWARVDLDNKERIEQRVFHIYGTGHSLAGMDEIYLETIQTHNGRYVWHVFEEPREPEERVECRDRKRKES